MRKLYINLVFSLVLGFQITTFSILFSKGFLSSDYIPKLLLLISIVYTSIILYNYKNISHLSTQHFIIYILYGIEVLLFCALNINYIGEYILWHIDYDWFMYAIINFYLVFTQFKLIFLIRHLSQ